MSARPPLIVETQSVAETLALGERIGRALRPNSVIALVGTLGSGKTHLVKGIARGNGVPDDVPVTSPTFVLVNEYPGRLHLYHIDAYRLRGPADLAALGFDEMAASGGAVIIEWADRVAELLPDDHLHIGIDITGPLCRRLTMAAHGVHSARLQGALTCD
jgi:tRNA threonylcarbamoyladenosine biosynthesis protein TsaE